MNAAPFIIAFITSCPIAWAEDAANRKPEAEGMAPWNKPISGEIGAEFGGREMARPIGRIEPGEGDLEPVPPTEAIPKKYAEEKAVAIKLEDLETIRERVAMQATLRIINPTEKAITFTGFSKTSPITKVQHLKKGKWEDATKRLKCGTGLRPCTIAPSQSVVFNFTVYSQNLPTRLGIACSGMGEEAVTVWSEKIER